MREKKLRYAYDVYNRNVSVTGDDFTQKNHYDAEGYRDSITEKDKVTNFVYQGGMLLHELDEDKNPARHYVLGNEYIGLDHNYYLTDEQGSVRYVLDAAGNVQNDYQYDAFGQCIAGQENIPNRLRYNAQIEDDLTGLYYLRARYYNTGIGRFTQEDVIYNDGLNLYAYCSSNPVMYADPSGYAGGSVKQKTCGSKETSYGKSSLIELKNTDNFMDSTIEHIFEGNVRRGKAGGYHYERIKDTAGNIVNGTEVLINDLGVYKAQVEVNGIPKSGNGGYSTFFPKEMSPQDVIDSINEAYNNKVFVVGSKNSYIGTSNNGLEIEMYINNNGKIISAFPKE